MSGYNTVLYKLEDEDGKVVGYFEEFGVALATAMALEDKIEKQFNKVTKFEVTEVRVTIKQG